ncbi:hypothetical protein [Metallibacterium sp.]
MNKYVALVLALACAVAACATSGKPTGAPDASIAPASATTAAPDDDRGVVRPPFKAVVPKLDSRTPAQIASAACRRADGSWACAGIKPLMAAGSGTAGNCGPACTVPDWYFDFANGTGCASDANSGTSATCGGAGIGPLLTVAQAFSRWGTRYPTFNAPSHVTTLHLMSSQPAGSASADPWGVFGPSAPDGMFAMTGALVPVGSPFTIGAVTQISRGAAGTDFQVAGMPGAAAQGQLLFDSTIVGGSYCYIDSLAVSTATCTSPQAGAALTTPKNSTGGIFVENGASWTGSSDTAQLYSVPSIFIDALLPNLGSMSAFGGTNTSGMTWLQSFDVADPSNTPGTSTFTVRAGGLLTMSMVRADSAININLGDNASLALSIPNPSLAGCWFPQSGTFFGDPSFYGGAVGTLGGSAVANGVVSLRNDVIMHGGPFFFGFTNAYDVHFAGGTTSVYPGASFVMRAATAPSVWGATTFKVYQNAAAINRTGGLWANNMQVTTLAFNSASSTSVTTGSGYAGSGVWTDGITLTSGNIDTGAAAGPGLWDLLTGGKFTN